MPSLRLSDSEASDVAAYLSSLKNPEFDAKPVQQSDPAMLDAVVLEFLRAGSTDAKSRQDLAAMSLEQKNLYAGKQLIGRYGCFACHDVPGFENSQRIGTELTEAGSKLLSQLDFGFLKVEHSRSEWYSQKLHDPRIFDVGRVKRPDELLKMPNFQFSDQEVNSIVMVLTSMVKDRVPLEMKDPAPAAVIAGRQLVAEKNCRGCHIIEGLGGDIRGHLRGIELQGQLPPNLNTQGHKTQPEWLHRFLMDPSRVRLRPWLNAVMPTFQFTEEEANTIGAYFSALDKVPYPYITTQVQSTPELLRAGADLFSMDKLQCGKCHPTGSTLPPGRDPSELAPDLGLAKERLRPDWVIRWLEDPQRIFPNTRMPTFWSLDEATRQRKSQFPEVLGGDSAQQMRAVRDHVYSIGGGRVNVSTSND
jgi:mono/diheme cytochrome c family protein